MKKIWYVKKAGCSLSYLVDPLGGMSLHVKISMEIRIVNLSSIILNLIVVYVSKFQNFQDRAGIVLTTQPPYVKLHRNKLVKIFAYNKTQTL